MRKGKFILNSFFILMLVLSALGNTAMSARADNKDLNADSNLLQLAREHLDFLFPVIVQKELKNKDLPDDDPEVAVEKANGQVHREKKMDFIASFSADLTGREIEKLAKNPKVRWVSLDAPLFTSGTVTSTVLDGFSAISFSGNDGTEQWRNDWQELGESDGAGAGVVQVKAGLTAYALFMGGSSKNIEGLGVSRQANLKNATSATFSFKYKRTITSSTPSSVRVQVSGDGGNSWTTLATYTLNATDSNSVAASFDISAYLAKKTQVRFIGSGTANGTFSVDEIQIAYVTTTNQAIPPTFTAVRDEFTTVSSYTGNNGTANWSTNWTESDTGGNPPASNGNIQVVAHANCDSGTGSCLSVTAKNAGNWVARTMNLAGATSATLTLFRNNMMNNTTSTDAVVLEASANGNTWTTLRTWWNSMADRGPANESLDLTPYISTTTQIRFRVLQASLYGSIYFDNIQIQYTPLVNVYDRAIKADKLWKKPPYLTGQGITVAVVDSGMNSHSDLQVSGSSSSRITASTTVIANTTPSDGYGHGTHVAGIITGNGKVSASQRTGIAPNVNLVNVKVSDDNGMSLGSDLVAGLQWVYDNRTTYNIKIVNISMNSSVAESYNTSPIDAAVEILWFNGIVVVVSAGNGGAGTVYPPANDPFVITVGATDDKGTASINDDAVSSFSAYGTTENGFVKPDLVAPGRNIISLLASTSDTAYINHPDYRVDNNYFRMSGTSMSAPVVSGAIALLLQDEPTLNPDQVKYRLMNTANKNWTGYNATSAGAGYLDVYAAVQGTTTETANTGIPASQMLATGSTPITWGSVGWNSVGWNSVGWNSVGWNSVGWNSVGWNSVGWNTDYWGP